MHSAQNIKKLSYGFAETYVANILFWWFGFHITRNHYKKSSFPTTNTSIVHIWLVFKKKIKGENIITTYEEYSLYAINMNVLCCMSVHMLLPQSFVLLVEWISTGPCFARTGLPFARPWCNMHSLFLVSECQQEEWGCNFIAVSFSL